MRGDCVNIYLTTGTYDFLQKRKDQFPNELILLMQSGGTALLLHETTGKTVFAAPRRYEVIAGKGTFQHKGFITMNNIPVTDEDRSTLEYRLKNQTGPIENAPGFIASRALRPIKSDTYIVLTAWEKESDFIKWKTSKPFFQAHAHEIEELKPSSTTTFFSPASYVSNYMVSSD